MTASRTASLAACLLVVAALALFLHTGIRLIERYSPTFDEGAHLVAGYSYWRTGSFKINPEHPPLAKLMFSLPLVIGEPELRSLDAGLLDHGNHWEVSRWFLANSPVPIDRLFFKARLVSLVFGMLLIVVIGWWSYRMWGKAPAVLSAWLAALDPNLQAHSCLLTMDVPLTLFATLTFYTLWEFLRYPTRFRLVAIGLALGLALATKFSAIFLVPLLVIAVAFHLLSGGSFRLPDGVGDSAPPFKARAREAFAPLFRIAVVAALVLVVVYFVVGLPAWGAGLKEQLVRTGRTNVTYLNCKVTPHGVWLYYPVVLALKTPIGLLLAFLLALCPIVIRPIRIAPLRTNEVRLLLLPAAGYFGLMVYSGVDLGVRLILPAYALLLVLAGRAVAIEPATPRGLRFLGWLFAVCAIGLTALSGLGQQPNQLSYFNEFVGKPENAYRRLADSNLDWGQDLKALKDELDRRQVPIVYLSYYGTMEPEWLGIRHQALPGFGRVTPPPPDRVPDDAPVKLLAISVNNLLGLYLDDSAMYRWLLDRPPAFRVGYSIHVYDLTGDKEALKRVRVLSR
jgi:hypothetical protein